MIEAYRIATNLVMDPSKITGSIGSVIQAFERLLSVQRDVQSGINEMASGIRASKNAAAGLVTQMQAAAKAARDFGAEMRRAGTAGSGGASGGSAAPLNSARQPAVPRGPGSALIISSAGNGGSFGPVGPSGSLVPFSAPGRGPIPLQFPTPNVLQPLSGSQIMYGAYGMQQGGRAVLGGIGDLWDAAAEPASIIEKMRAAQFTEAQIAKSQALARALVSSVPGFRYGQGLDLINQTASLTGNPDEAMGVSGSLARDAQVLAQYGHHGAIEEIEKAAKAGELTGLTDKAGKMNLPKLIKFVDALTAVDVSSAGTMDMAKYLTGVRQFGVGADAASMDFMTAVLPAYNKIMGEAKAGTAFASLMQSLSSVVPNTQNKKYFLEQQRLGLRGADGEVTQGDLLRTNPNDWFQQVLMKALAADKKLTAADIQAELYRIFPRQTMVRVGAASIFDEAVIDKEAKRNRDQIAAGSGPLDALLRNNPLNNVKAFSAALNLLEVTLADPAMGNATGALKGLTGVLQGFADFAAKHPGMASAGVTGAAVTGGATYVAGSALILGLFAKKAAEIVKWGLGALSKNTIAPGESIFDAMDGSSIAGRAMQGATGLGKALGVIGLPFALKEAFYDTPKRLMFGKDVSVTPWGSDKPVQVHESGLADFIKAIKDAVAGVAHAAPMQVNVNMDSRKIASFLVKPATGVQSGTTGFDGSMHQYPAGAPAGGLN